jgi:hypothetical protein
MATARQACLEAYGGQPPRCAWCGNTTGLELDHIVGGAGEGNRHRDEIKGKLEYWLQRQGFPPGYQCLCKRCHNWKSGRIKAMPPRTGKTNLRVEIEAETAAQVDRLAATGRTKREIVEAAIQAYVEGGAQEAMLTTVQTRLDTLTARLEMLEAGLTALLPLLTDVLTKALQPLESKLQSVVDGQKALERQYHTQIFTTIALLNDEVAAVKKRVEKRGVLW